MEEYGEFGCIKKVYFNLLWIIFSLIFVWFVIWAKGIDIAREIEVKCDYFMINFCRYSDKNANSGWRSNQWWVLFQWIKWNELPSQNYRKTFCSIQLTNHRLSNLINTINVCINLFVLKNRNQWERAHQGSPWWARSILFRFSKTKIIKIR